jgi:glycosyltransferase involved in cell wall biosynthesis
VRILQVSSFMPPHAGGLELMVQNLTSGLAARGHTLRWLASADPLPPGVTGHLERVAAWKQLEELLHVPLPVWTPGGYAVLLRASGWADVVHVHDCLYPSSMIAAAAARVRGRPLVVTQHIGAVPYGSLLDTVQRVAYQSLGRAVLEAASAVVVYSKHVPPYFASLGVRRPFELIPLGFDARFAPADAEERLALRRAWGLPEEGPLVLFAGRLVPKKGVRHVVDVQRALAAEGVTLVVAGDGALAPLLADLPGLVHIPATPYERMHELYRLADLLLLPSVGEGLPLTLQEAMLCGLPAVVSRDPSYVENLGDAPGVSMVEPGPQLVATVRARLAAPVDRRGIAGYAAERWGEGPFVTAYEALYRRLLA